jgi:hypothetical protein
VLFSGTLSQISRINKVLNPRIMPVTLVLEVLTLAKSDAGVRHVQ